MASAASDIGRMARKLASIASLTDAERQAIEALPLTVRIFEPGEDIVRDRDRPSHCCLLLSGWGFRYKVLPDGKRQILSFHIPGDVPDLQSLHLQVMDHSLGVTTTSSVGLIPHEALREMTRRFPGVAAIMWRDTLIDAAIFREWMTGIGRRTAHGRIAHMLCELYLRLHAVGLAEGFRCDLPITQIDIGDALGLSNVHVNRVLQDLRGRGLIMLRGRSLAIEDWSALTKVAEFDPTYLHLVRPRVN
ncbi:Crp/Fnr family transcriptional regulator [Methylobacterium planeticum]|uniref:Crp/Fnr family transcriptional regulator n=1 Tax=Methylobacterium planeticum TaxID=2615211 RepID=A0A6N6MS48_9HYPH|nr:Crp/Fnr family transcriptional regulator [Methylobacterium planeticum]KAB1074030.1 Crp/Fnr family transcriptional regulator [Methylobacterium planeticum]